MKQEQLKKLAEWYYKKGAALLNPSTNDRYLNVQESPTMMGGWIKFQPHKDSNQLDQLEDKMIKELKIKMDNNLLQYSMFFHNEQNEYDAHYYNNDEPYNLFGKGKTKNEARLNAILNYMEKK